MSKAEVIINRITVDLDNDFSITLEKNSQLTQFEELIDTWAYNLSFPKSETNQKAFEHAERFEKKFSTWQQYTLQFFFNGRLLLNGYIKAKFKSGKYQGYAYGTFGTAASVNSSKRIKDIAFPTYTFTNKAEYTLGTDPYCLFPVFNADFYDGRGEQVQYTDTNGDTKTRDSFYIEYLTTMLGYQNRFDTSTNLFIKANGTTNYLAIISPFMFVWYIVETIFKSFGINVAENILKNTFNTSTGMFLYKFRHNKNIKPGMELFTPSSGDWMTGEGLVIKTTRSNKSVTTFNPSQLLPEDFSVKDYLIGIQNFLNVIFDCSDKKAEVKILDREAIILGPAIDIDDKLLQSPELDFEKEKKVILKFDIDSDDNGWNQYKDELSDEQWTRFKGEVADYATLDAITTQEIGDIWYVQSIRYFEEYRKITLEWEVEGGTEIHEVIDWQPIAKFGQPFQIGNSSADETTIESKFSVIDKHSGSGAPTASLTGNSMEFSADPKPFLPRIMFYRGLDSNSEPDATPVGGDIDQDWRSSNSIYEKRWKHTANAIKDGIKGFAQFDFNEVDFNNLNLNQKFRIKEGTFLILKTTTTFTHNQVKPTEAEILKLP